MSEGQFIRSKYETNGGGIVRIRVQPETELFSIGGVVNDAPGGAVNVPGQARVSKTRRQFGIGPRKVGFVFDDGQAPAGFEAGNIYYIPIMTRAVYDGIAIDEAATYRGGTGNIVSKLEESIK